MAENIVTLTSLAMLKVNFDTGFTDYIDYLVPFINHILAQRNLDPVTDDKVADALVREFGIKIPTKGVQLVLRRLARRKVLEKNHGIFTVVKDLPTSDIPERRTEAQICIQNVISHLIKFMKNQFDFTWNDFEASQALLTFLSRFSIACLRTYIFGTALPQIPKETPGTLYQVSCFISNAYENKLELFERIIVVIKGQMLANALLCPDLESMQRKFDRITFYFDTPLILRALGYHVDSEKQAIIELISLIKNLGGITAVFEHSVEETSHVLKYCEENIENPNARGRIINEMRQQRRTRSDIALSLGRLNSDIYKVGLTRLRTPDYTRVLQQIDETILENALDEDIGYNNPRAKIYDINSIRSIYALRKGLSPVRLEDAAAVLVTSNRDLAKVAFEYGREHESTREISSVITSYSLANIAWLKSPLGAPDLPMHELLAVCYAAMKPDDRLWSRYLEEIDKLSAQGKVTPTDHEALRYSLRANDELMNLTLGDEESLTERTVTEILERIKVEYTQEKTKEVMKEKEAHAETLRIRDDLMNKRLNSRKRLFWISTSISKWLSHSIALLFGFLLLVFLLISPYVTTEYVTSSYWYTFYVNTIIIGGVVWSILNWYIGLTINGLTTYLNNRICPWIFQKLCLWFLGDSSDFAKPFDIQSIYEDHITINGTNNK